MADLIETMARAMCKARADWYGTPLHETPERTDLTREMSRAALSAIEAAGHRVVPVEPTYEMQTSVNWQPADKWQAATCWAAMLAAAPKVTP